MCVYYFYKREGDKMKITPISMHSNYGKNIAKFKGNNNEIKPLIKLDESIPDDKVVSYGTWGSNYVYPITAGQLRNSMRQEQLQKTRSNIDFSFSKKETPEEYLARKLYSTEWTT